ncbi:MAG: hypothetical protein K2I75_06695 [Clostridiales bacterium]|nr:hypothetical protein [Clostridiales bacterium]
MNTSQAELIKKCRNDLQRERIVKSVLSGMATGFSVMFVIAFITWIVEFKGLWLSLGLGAAAWIGASLFFYFIVFSFSDMEIMQRIDRAGLDERMVTMYQLQGDDSYMAQRQREDAAAAFATAVKKSGGQLIKTKITTAIICATAIACPFGTGMTVLTALSDYDVIPTLYELGSGGFGFGIGGTTTPTYTVTYRVGGDEEGGTILVSGSDSTVDKVKAGGTSSAKAQYAVGYYIEKWVNEKGEEYYPNPTGYQPTVFCQDNVVSNMTVTVYFAKYDDEEDLGYNYYYDPDNQNKDNQDGPQDPSDGDGDGQPDDAPTPDNTPPAPPLGGPGGGNPATPGNAIVDGETQYGENYKYYYDLAMDMMANGTDGYPPELVAALEAYFGILL